MIYRKVEIMCPNCGRSKVFERMGASSNFISKNGETIEPGEVLRATCQNMKCKLEFITEIEPTENEQPFIDEVLEVGMKKGWWAVDRFIVGGSLAARTVYGADFLIYNMGGGALWLEYKHSDSLILTNAQLSRFLHSIDTSYVATRLCGAVSSKGSEGNKIVVYWTPKFIASLPQESITPLGDRQHYIHFGGLEACIRDHTFTRWQKESTVNELTKMPNLTIFRMLGGWIGSFGAKYDRIPQDATFKILLEKLRYTITHLDEDAYNFYPPCKIIVPEERLARQRIDERLEQLVGDAYRPLYVVDVVKILERDQAIFPALTFVNNIAYIGRTDLATIVSQSCQKGVREGVFVPFVFDSRETSYGLWGRNYIPLSRNGSFLLDGVKAVMQKRFAVTSKFELANLLRKGKSCTSLGEIHQITGVARDTLLKRLYGSREELEVKKLFEIHKEIKRPPSWILCLTEMGINYITRTEQFLR